MPIELWQGLLIPFAGTTLGAACVFFMRNNLGEMVQRALTGFAAGVMVAASIWSLLLPAMEQAADMGGGPLSRRCRFLARHPIPAGTGSADSASAPRQRGGRGHQKQSWTNNHADLGCGACTIFRKEWRWARSTPGGSTETAVSRWRGRWPFHWGSPFRTSRRARSFSMP